MSEETELPKHHNFKDITGNVYSRLTVLRCDGKKGDSPQYSWLCRCTCGKEVVVMGCNLKNGNVKSCGCLSREILHKRSFKHGKLGSRVYNSWQGMLQRCNRKNDVEYSNYGGRGIEVCESWKTFDNFYADMGDADVGMTLDRVDNNQGYCKENCRWASRKEQSNNKRTNLRFLFEGKDQTLAELCGGSKNSKYYMVLRRIRKGWNIEAALNIPPNPSYQRTNVKEKSCESYK